VEAQKRERVIVIKIPEDQYKRLEERAKALGFTLASDYVRYLVFKDLEAVSEAPKLGLEINALERIVTKSLEKMIAEGKITIEKIIERIIPKIERRIFDKVNPFTSKIDMIARHQAELREIVEVIVEKIKNIDERVSNLEKRVSESIKTVPSKRKKKELWRYLRNREFYLKVI